MSAEASGGPIRAAAYVRMPDRSPEILDCQPTFRHRGLCGGPRHGDRDEGKSGLVIDHRDALKKLLDDVGSGQADFELILAYDVSRWGRFQDIDESAHYEFMCRRAGIQVHCCAEQFENDGSPLAAIIKGIKRAMASEYSRELSRKAFMGQSRLVKLGYSLGASAPYGLRRMLVDQNGKPKCLLERGDKKAFTRTGSSSFPARLRKSRSFAGFSRLLRRGRCGSARLRPPSIGAGSATLSASAGHHFASAVFSPTSATSATTCGIEPRRGFRANKEKDPADR